MRTGEGEKEYADFILKVGNGEVPTHDDLGQDLIEIPEDMICDGDIIDEVFGEDPDWLDVE